MKSIKRQAKNLVRRRLPVLFIVFFATAGGIGLLLATRAVTPTAHFEPESGTIASPAAVVPDSSASGGSAVEFRAGGGTPGGQTCAPFPSFPDANCTGYPAGTQLAPIGTPAGTSLVGGQGQSCPGGSGGSWSELQINASMTIDAKDITRPLRINANNVTIKNSHIHYDIPFSFAAIFVKAGVTGFRIENTTINGGTQGMNSMGIYAPDTNGATITGNDISGVENAIVPGDGTVITGNYLHGLDGANNFSCAPEGPHWDVIQMDGGQSNVTITHNNIVNVYGQTAAIMMDTYSGSISNVSITQNRIIGGGITIYHIKQDGGGNTLSGNRVDNNRIGGWDVMAAESCVYDFASWTNNVNDTTGAVIPKPSVRTQAQCI